MSAVQGHQERCTGGWATDQLVQTLVGVLQGCILSPLLFNILLEVVMALATTDVEFEALISGHRISNLRFADDIYSRFADDIYSPYSRYSILRQHSIRWIIISFYRGCNVRSASMLQPFIGLSLILPAGLKLSTCVEQLHLHVR